MDQSKRTLPKTAESEGHPGTVGGAINMLVKQRGKASESREEEKHGQGREGRHVFKSQGAGARHLKKKKRE